MATTSIARIACFVLIGNVGMLQLLLIFQSTNVQVMETLLTDSLIIAQRRAILVLP